MLFLQDISNIFTLLGATLLWLLTASGAAWLLIKFLGKKWLENKFSKDMEKYKSELQGKISKELEAEKNKYAKELAEQQKTYTAQIEALKNKLAYSLARKSKFAEKEFDVLVECWKRISALRSAVIQIETHGISYFRKYYIKNKVLFDLSELTLRQCKESLKIQAELSEREREIIAQQEPKEREIYFSYYMVLFYRKKYSQKQGDFSIYFLNNRVFLNYAMQADFQNVWRACVPIDKQAEQLMTAFPEEKLVSQRLESLNKQLPPLMEAMNNKFWQLERIVANRLFPEEQQSGG